MRDKADCVLRGEVWRYSVLQGRSRVYVIVSNDGTNRSSSAMVSGALLVAEDPGSLVAVDAAGLGWVRADRVESLSRKHLVEQVGALDADLMATVDDRLRAYFSL